MGGCFVFIQGGYFLPTVLWRYSLSNKVLLGECCIGLSFENVPGENSPTWRKNYPTISDSISERCRAETVAGRRNTWRGNRPERQERRAKRRAYVELLVAVGQRSQAERREKPSGRMARVFVPEKSRRQENRLGDFFPLRRVSPQK